MYLYIKYLYEYVAIATMFTGAQYIFSVLIYIYLLCIHLSTHIFILYMLKHVLIQILTCSHAYTYLTIHNKKYIYKYKYRHNYIFILYMFKYT